jgi:hypothetical protein
MSDLDPIRKNRIMVGGIKYRSTEQIITEISALMEKHRVIMYPSDVMDRQINFAAVSKEGKPIQHQFFLQQFTFVDIDSGEKQVVCVPTEAMDAQCSGRSTLIAKTYSLKILFEQMFLISEQKAEEKEEQKASLPGQGQKTIEESKPSTSPAIFSLESAGEKFRFQQLIMKKAQEVDIDIKSHPEIARAVWLEVSVMKLNEDEVEEEVKKSFLAKKKFLSPSS